MLFLTIPTAHSHPELLQAIINESTVPREHIILVATKPNLSLPEGCVIIEDFGSPNIQRWWNTGIEEATHRGATAVAVLNDDLTINDQTLPILHLKLQETNATIATPTRADWGPGHYTNSNLFPYTPVIWGCLWMVDTTKDLRPDPQYVWWYGDSDLDIRARRDYAGIVSADVYYEHYFPGEGTGANQDLVEQTHRDGETFERNYAEFLKTSRATPPRKLFIQTQQFAGRSQPESTYRQDFRDYVATQADPTRDRIVLLEPNTGLHHELTKLWGNWSNVLIRSDHLSAELTTEPATMFRNNNPSDSRQSAFSLDISRLDPNAPVEITENPTINLQALIGEVTPGAKLDTIAFDSRVYNFSEVASNSTQPRELIAIIADSNGKSVHDQAKARNLLFTGRPWGEAHTTAAFSTTKRNTFRAIKTKAGHAVSALTNAKNNAQHSKFASNHFSTKVTRKFDKADLLDNDHGLHLTPIDRTQVESILRAASGNANTTQAAEQQLEWSVSVDTQQEVTKRIHDCYSKHGVWPISFSIPNYIPLNPHPTQLVSPILPGYPYSFDAETEYLTKYSESYFALTHRKVGWDCFRHVEIMASGSVPLMPDSTEIPEFAMVHYPKRAFTQIAGKVRSEGGRPSEKLRADLREFFTQNLTTKAMARYLLNAALVPTDASVLFLDQNLPTNPEYLSTLTAIGLKENLGTLCTIHHNADFLYQDSNQLTHQFYGRGFGYVKKLDPALRCQPESQAKEISPENFDYAVIGSVTRNQELTDLVLKNFPPDRIILIHGEDQPPPVEEVHALRSSGAHVFIRSIY